MKIAGYIITLIFILGLTGSCAKTGTIVGGPKDNIPPKVLSSEPDNEAINFKGKKVEITFDEYLKFKDKDKVFVTSPPFKKKPEVLLIYKNVVVNFKEDLLPDRTYTLNFGNSITDNNEGNPIRDYEFVFSTGNYIDSLSFEGQVLSAFNHQPDKDGLYVMLYDVMGDSVPMKYLPTYIAKTNAKGFFKINHIKADTFMVVALKDVSGNNLYESTEDIAFSDSLLHLDNSFYHALDSAVLKDTATTDSAYYSRFKPQMTLYTFVKENKKQFLASKERKQANQLFFTFNIPLDTFKISLEGSAQPASWFLKEESANRDSITLWITDTTLLKRDTLRTVLIYPMVDSMNISYPKYDTITMVYKAPKETRRQKQDEAEAKAITLLSVSTNAREGFDLNSRIIADADFPIDSIDLSKVYFTYTEDSVYKPVKFNLRKDSFNIRKFFLDFKPIGNAEYYLVFDSLAITSIYNTHNDSTGIKFRAQKDDYYGAIKATVSNVHGSLILQVLTEKEVLVKTAFLKEDELVTLDFLAPGQYMLKVIHDNNGNGRWDPGNFIKKRQPEKVEYYSGIIKIRSNWDVEVKWELGK